MANGTILAAANTTLNATTNATTQLLNSTDIGPASQLFFSVLVPQIFARFFGFIIAPFIYPEMWWLLIHVILTFILFEFYFERHETEDLGWSAALANSIVMVFVSMELLRALYHHEGTPLTVFIHVVNDFLTYGLFAEKTAIISLVVFLGVLGLGTAVINYFHFLPRSLAFLISGHKTVNLLAYFLIVLVWRYTSGNPLPLDWATFLALILFGAMLWGILFFINHKMYKRKIGKSPFD